jgi:hypothetical protein
MSNPIASATSNVAHSVAKGQEAVARQSPKQSFETVFQNGNPGATPQASGGQTDQQLAALQQDLMKSIRGGANAQSGSLTDMRSALIDGSGKFDLMKEALSRANGSAAGSKDLRNIFSQTENEWRQVESIMNSAERLNQGQLLALQARLYQVSQHIEVMAKVVDQMTGGVKTVLNTNI